MLETLRRISGFPNAAVDLALQPQLRIVDDKRATDENVEERGDVFAVDTLDLGGNRFLQSCGELRDLGVGGGRGVVLGHVEEDEIVVIWKGNHQPG